MKDQILERIVAEVPQELKRRAAAKAAYQGKSLKDALIEALELWLTEDDEAKRELHDLSLSV